MTLSHLERRIIVGKFVYRLTYRTTKFGMVTLVVRGVFLWVSHAPVLRVGARRPKNYQDLIRAHFTV